MEIFEDKYFIFLTSAGRTGTKFFGDLLGEMVKDAFSIHEPDVLMDFKLKSFRQLQMFGLYNLIIGKLFNKTGIRNLSQNYLAGKIDTGQVNDAIVRHRRKYYNAITAKMIIESYSGWYGVIPGIRRLYKNYKIVILLRDPRDWVTSNMNWGTMYGKRDWVSRLGLGRLNPEMIGDVAYSGDWQRFSRFQKLCWAWKTIYEIVLNSTADDANVAVVKFEDIFKSNAKYETLGGLLDSITRFSDVTFPYTIPTEILERKVNKNITYRFPQWEHWNNGLKKDLISICGTLAKKLGYFDSATLSKSR